MTGKKPFVLMILDGWGIADKTGGNAVGMAETPNLDRLISEYPSTTLECSGESVGLPAGVMGNSEVGHLNIGAGRIVYQDLLKIDVSIRNRSFFENRAFSSAMDSVAMNASGNNGSSLHIMGLVSDGGVHSVMRHLFALVDMAVMKKVEKVYIHAITDGRDTPPDSGLGYISGLVDYIKDKPGVKVGTVCGRFYSMDRDTRWERTEKAYRLYTEAEGRRSSDPVAAVREAYELGETDEFIAPVCIDPESVIKDGDAVIFFNFRADRARQITRAMNFPDFEFFKRNLVPKLSDYVCMTRYDEKFTLPVAFPPESLTEILGGVISEKGLRQLRIAETEKYAHVTYFFNGGEEKPFPGEDRALIPSPREVKTYDLKPEMSARAVADELLSRLDQGVYDFCVVNFANMDMVGHTGIIDAAVRAAETVDSCVGEIVEKVRSMGGALIITADHGNAEKMMDESGSPHTAHTLNPVPFVLVDDRRMNAVLKKGSLCDIAPTVLELLEIAIPSGMTGKTLIEK